MNFLLLVDSFFGCCTWKWNYVLKYSEIQFIGAIFSWLKYIIMCLPFTYCRQLNFFPKPTPKKLMVPLWWPGSSGPWLKDFFLEFISCYKTTAITWKCTHKCRFLTLPAGCVDRGAVGVTSKHPLSCQRILSGRPFSRNLNWAFIVFSEPRLLFS